MKKFCYWSVADGRHAKMMETCIKSARDVGVTEDFHIWTDTEIEGAITHPCGDYNKHKYLFKFKFLFNQVQKLDYDYFIWIDADNCFTRHPGEGTFDNLLRDSKIFVQLENECTSSKVKRGDWWSMPIKFWNQTLRYKGVDSKKIWNTNAGMWIVRKDAIVEFYEKAMEFWNYCYHELGIEFTEEAPLAYVGHIMQNDIEQSTLENTCQVWACDWNGNYKNKLPDGKEWEFEDYMTGEKRLVNPSIVHAMRSKRALVKGSSLKPHECGYWMGHNNHRDILGFCAAAHLMHIKTGDTIAVNFNENDRGLTKYFPGIEWVARNELTEPVDCGILNDLSEMWKLNAVTRFYRFMDPTMESEVGFNLNMTLDPMITEEKTIGIVSHHEFFGEINSVFLRKMIKDAKNKYPTHKITLFCKEKPKEIIKDIDNVIIYYDIYSLIANIRQVDLLLSIQGESCLIAAGFKIPLWLYKSSDPRHDMSLNFSTYKVEKTYDRYMEVV